MINDNTSSFHLCFRSSIKEHQFAAPPSVCVHQLQLRTRNFYFPSNAHSIPFSHKKFTRSPSKLSFGTGSTRLRLLRGNGTSHAHNHDLCKGGAQDAAQMQPRERMQLHQPTHGTLLTHTSPPRPFFGFFFFFFFF